VCTAEKSSSGYWLHTLHRRHESYARYVKFLLLSRDKNAAEDFIRYPRLIVEVLSPTTAAFDRGDKFADYRKCETLEEYVLINQERVGVECFRRNAEGLWVLHPYIPGEEVELASVNFKCAIEAIYEDATPNLVNYQ